MDAPAVTGFHVVLFCRKWDDSVTFYRDILGLPVTDRRKGFLEFQVTPEARIGLLREVRSPASVRRDDRFILSFRVPDIRATHRQLQARCPDLPAVREHPWGAWVFELTDPEERRLEFWSPGGA
jgi:catechol 2,3-dioxygenase-like lactoylglutathione lyase family enzyme